MTWEVLTLGVAAGEAGLAAAFVAAATARGHPVHAWALEAYAHHLEAAGARVDIARTPEPIATSAARAHMLVCATSLTCAKVMPALDAVDARIVSLDSSWLPWIAEIPASFVRFDRFFVSMPPDVFHLGLGQNRGRFAVPPEILRRVRPVGWFAPSVGRTDAEPSALIYFGRGYDPAEFVCRDTLGPAIAAVAARHPELRWRYVGRPGLPLPSCVEVHDGWLDEATFARWHADAELVVCHHGQVTIGRAAACGVPVLAIIDGTIFRPFAGAGLGDYEVRAFGRAGVVEEVYGAAPIGALARRMEALLARGRVAPSGGGGADAAVRAVEDML